MHEMELMENTSPSYVIQLLSLRLQQTSWWTLRLPYEPTFYETVGPETKIKKHTQKKKNKKEKGVGKGVLKVLLNGIAQSRSRVHNFN